jgi:hypothetical protein
MPADEAKLPAMRRVLGYAVVGACCLAVMPAAVRAEKVSSAAADGPVGSTIGAGEVIRKAASPRAPHGPWKSAVVLAVIARAGAKAGELMTAIPLRAGLAPMDLKITSVEAQPATDLSQATWMLGAETSLEELLTAKADPGRSEERPLEVIVVYPAQSHAHLLASKVVAPDLPKERGCSTRTLFGAVDFDDDGRADAEDFRFCCERPNTTWKATGGSPCNSNCESTFVRRGGGAWKAVYEAGGD